MLTPGTLVKHDTDYALYFCPQPLDIESRLQRLRPLPNVTDHFDQLFSTTKTVIILPEIA